MIGTCVDIEFFLLGSSSLALWPLTWVNIFSLALMLIISMLENSLYIDYVHVDGTGMNHCACR